jgi:hypothetical protein
MRKTTRLKHSKVHPATQLKKKFKAAITCIQYTS